MTWQLSAFTDEAGATADEQIAAALEANLHLVDLRSIDGFNITQLPVEQAREIKAKLDAAGLKVGMFGSPIGKIDLADDFEIDRAKLRHLGELAPIFGCHDVRIFSYFNEHKQPHEAWKNETLRRLTELRDEAVQLGLVLFHENESDIFGQASSDVLILAQELRDPSGPFRFIFDFDNFNNAGENVWESWVLLRDHTDAIHLKDSRDGQHMPAGEGAGFIPEILADAAARGWDGFLSVEPHLSHSAAVAATGPSGQANAKYGEMPLNESFVLAVNTAHALLKKTGVSYN